jgi:RNA-directed DNA polymerase
MGSNQGARSIHPTAAVNRAPGPTDWNSINWRRTNRQVRNLRQRIFRAAAAGDLKRVRSLQKLMLRSRANTLASVRRVTQINTGKRTAGVDKVLVKTPAARGKLVDDLSTYQPWNARPARRIYIPKANGKLRPLGIPVVRDRCFQAIVKNALEPEWEARFETTSYGFRPGRSAHDAIAKIFNICRPTTRKKWVVDADIKGCFDNIDHEFLLRAVGFFPGRELIRQWLKAGYMENGSLHETPAGTPQGGVVSPLLANIALHGLETILGVRYRKNGWMGNSPRAVVRYADDFAVFCETKEDAEACIPVLEAWLKDRGLTLAPEKTRITHVSEGFDFLGFNVRQYKVTTTRTGWKLLIKPSKRSVAALLEKLRREWRRLRGQNVPMVLRNLNPIIRGWANYFRIGVSSELFGKLDSWMFRKAWAFVSFLHPKKGAKWRKDRYWGRLNAKRMDNWVFGDTKVGGYLQKFAWFPIERHALVVGKASPDDPALREYWAKRNASSASMNLPVASDRIIAARQQHVCPWCGNTLYNGEELHRDHVVPKSEGGPDAYSNLRLLHLYCHQQRHALEGRQ